MISSLGHTLGHTISRIHRAVVSSSSLSGALGRPRRTLEETLTLHRLDVVVALSVSVKTTNLIETIMARVDATTLRVDRWRTSDQKLRWCAAALLAVEPRLRLVKNIANSP